MSATTGRCLCGALRYELTGGPGWVAYCHCESCRRQTSSPVTTFIGVKRAQFRYTRGAPAVYGSSPGVRRTFCACCGSPMAYETAKRPDDIDLYAVTLDDPGAVWPTMHVHAAEQLPWIEIADDLPRHAGASSTGEPMRIGPKRD
jgi:hypothetical protein